MIARLNRAGAITPLAVEPYDKDWGVGISGCTQNPSPFPRINRMLDWIKAKAPFIHTQRGMIWTEEVLRGNQDEPLILRCAKAFNRVTEEVDINIYPDELLVGEAGCPARCAAVFPEFALDWLVKELNYQNPDDVRIVDIDKRINDRYLFNEQIKHEVTEMYEAWSGKTLTDCVSASFDEEEKKGIGESPMVYANGLYFGGGIGHHCIDWKKLMRLGYGGLRKEVQEALAKLNMQQQNAGGKKTFYEAMLLCLDGATTYFRRYSKLAEERAAEENDPLRKAELQIMSKNLAHVATEPPRNFWEGMQLWILGYDLILIESNGHSVAFGRMDVLMKDLYDWSIASGEMTREFAQELIECFFIKIHHLNKLRRGEAYFSGGGTFYGGTAMIVGGCNEETGADVTNDLSYMALDAHAHTRIPNPWIGVRLSKNSPREFWTKVFNVIRIGTGEPKVYNEEALMETMRRCGGFGISAEEARTCVPVGCVEPTVPGKQYGWHDAAYVNLTKILQLALNDGICPECSEHCKRYAKCVGIGLRYGIGTGYLRDFESFEEVKDAYDKQLAYWSHIVASNLRKFEMGHEVMKPTPFLSIFFDDCIRRGIDLAAGGAKYNTSGPQGVGLGTVTDSLVTVKQLVFEEKKVSAEELIAAVNADWKGYETLQALINSDRVHHYGNDDDYADEIASWVVERYCAHIEKEPTHRAGGRFIPGIYSISMNVPHGMAIPASLDGRNAYEPVSDCLGPVHGHDIYGPTCISNSVAKLDQTRITNGVILNWKFSPSTLMGDVGRDNLISLIKVYFDKGGLQSQFNVVSKETLCDAQKHPENYKDLLVRIAGYSTYFIGLSPQVQKDIIERTELSFD